MIAALFVINGGPYYDLPDVDPWPVARDARKYEGPHAIVAHPPCERWGSFWWGGPTAKLRRRRGDDGGCFSAALSAVQAFGGIVEHPCGSSAWRAHNLATPPRAGGWVSAGMFAPGWTCCVEQGHYGHRARKPTWLYLVGEEKPAGLIWGRSAATALISGMASSLRGLSPEERHAKGMWYLHQRERMETPEAFRDLLIAMAESTQCLSTTPRP